MDIDFTDPGVFRSYHDLLRIGSHKLASHSVAARIIRSH